MEQGLRWLWEPQRWSGTRGEEQQGTLWAHRCSSEMKGHRRLLEHVSVPVDHRVPQSRGRAWLSWAAETWELCWKEGAPGRGQKTQTFSLGHTHSFTEHSRFLLCWSQPFLTLMQSSTVKKPNPNKPQSNHKALSCLLTPLLIFPGYSTLVRSQCPYKMITKFSSSPRKSSPAWAGQALGTAPRACSSQSLIMPQSWYYSKWIFEKIWKIYLL